MSSLKSPILWFSEKIFINKTIFSMSQKKYKKVEEYCKERLKKHPENYGALYSLALNNYYKKDLNTCFNYFLRLLSTHKVSSKVQKWFIQRLIEYQLYERRLFDVVAERCENLFEKVNNKEIEILLLKYASVANYELKRFKKVFDVCIKLEDRNYQDKHTERYKSESKKKIDSNFPSR